MLGDLEPEIHITQEEDKISKEIADLTFSGKNISNDKINDIISRLNPLVKETKIMQEAREPFTTKAINFIFGGKIFFKPDLAIV